MFTEIGKLLDEIINKVIANPNAFFTILIAFIT